MMPTLKIRGLRDPQGLPTCSTGIGPGESCIALGSRLMGLRDVCLLTTIDVHRGPEPTGHIRPCESCPVWAGVPADAKHYDRNGVRIKSGDVLYNPNDSTGWHRVISDDAGRLYLGDLESPLERYAPAEFWRVVPCEGEK